MGKISNTKFKKGAASFYIIASATLILLVIATSFAAIIISAVTRSSNDDLSQSAYDSALAGVEDAKIAFANYESCVAQNARADASADAGTCGYIMYQIENPDCDSVANATGRTVTDGAVSVEETNLNTSNNMVQAYTCAILRTSLSDYRSTLSSSNQMRVIKAKFEEGIHAKDIKTIRVSWYSDTNGSNYVYSNYDVTTGKVVFPQSGFSVKTAAPPTISVALVQAPGGNQEESFSMSDFDRVEGDNKTNRALVYLVPTGENESGNDDDGAAARVKKDGSHLAGYDAAKGINYIEKKDLVDSNRKVTRNLPHAVYCSKGDDSGAEFACSVTIELPEPIGGDRSDDNFLIAVSLPYGKPSTDFSVEFYCAEGTTCATDVTIDEDGSGEITSTSNTTNRANLDGVQIEIDSTGRANDLYRRVQVRLESADNYSLSLMGPLELLGNGDEDVLNKEYTVTTEWNFNG